MKSGTEAEPDSAAGGLTLQAPAVCRRSHTGIGR